jgi:transposase-like protein
VRAELIDAARPARHAIRDGWSVDETYVKVAGRWTYLYRAIDQHGQVIEAWYPNAAMPVLLGHSPSAR